MLVGSRGCVTLEQKLAFWLVFVDCRWGNPGDVEPVGEGVSELRIDYGPGYRVYYKQQGKTLVILLAGGDKRTQKRDIENAKELARGL